VLLTMAQFHCWKTLRLLAMILKADALALEITT